jgi:hypothetical protein
VVAEPEANHNAAAFLERFEEALNYYASLFDYMEAGGSRPRSSPASSLYLFLKDVKVEDNKIQGFFFAYIHAIW